MVTFGAGNVAEIVRDMEILGKIYSVSKELPVNILELYPHSSK